jgi:hypothetical protein
MNEPNIQIIRLLFDFASIFDGNIEPVHFPFSSPKFVPPPFWLLELNVWIRHRSYISRKEGMAHADYNKQNQ